MSVRAKFLCNTVTRSEASETVAFTAVISGPDNEQWSKWTPSGSLSLSITNPVLFGYFEPGRSYYLDISLVA